MKINTLKVIFCAIIFMCLQFTANAASPTPSIPSLFLGTVVTVEPVTGPNPFSIIAPPTITPDPLYPATVTTKYTIADSVADGLDLDTNVSQNGGGNNPNAVYGFTTQMKYICGNWADKSNITIFRCFRHIRDGLLVGDSYPAHTADFNFMGSQFGIGDFNGVNTTDADNTILNTNLSKRLINLDAIAPFNEPDSCTFGANIHFSSMPIGSTQTAINVLNCGPQIGSQVTIGEGPNIETNTISNYIPPGGTINIVFASPVANTHKGGVDTTLTAAVVAATVEPYVIPPSPMVSPIALPNYPAAPTPTPGIINYISLANIAGISPGDYLTINCNGINFGNSGNTEVVQVSNSFVAGTGAGNIPLATNLIYSHSVNENVVEGCIKRVNDNVWGSGNDFGKEIVRIKNDSLGIPVMNVAFAGSAGSGNVFSPTYGGIRLNYNSFDITQIHGYCSGNCFGPFGDGVVGFGNNHPFCFGQNCSYSSWQYQLTSGLTEGGIFKPVWCTECGWPIVPVGAPGANTNATTLAYGSNGQLPDDVGAVWESRDTLGQLLHGYNRVYTFQLMDGPGGFCTYALVRDVNCGGTAGYGLASGDAPKAAYNALTDVIGLMTDSGCKFPGCKLNTDSLTWAWTSLPTVHHGNNYQATDPSQLRSGHYEFSDGSVLVTYYYEATDYLQSATSSSCYTKTSCYQWCGNGNNTNPNANLVTCFSTNMYMLGAHNWGNCTHYDMDDNVADTNLFGHFVPTGNMSFNSSDQISLNIKPEVQMLYCKNTGLTPVPQGTAIPFPSPLASSPATPDPLPVYPSPTAMATAIPSP